ncbi:MAG TPA: MBL fold metallo-hydrolase [Polyangia bacterium]|nr:MBL fold metallo-hydrolase [Polyangia bacterium]
MEITFWGVRGSIPAPGPETNRFGGNTSCVGVRSARGELVILDAGTGIVNLGKKMMTQEFGQGRGEATILLSHAHWDHIQGFPFFVPVLIPGNRFTVYGPSRSSGMLEGILEGQMNPHFSPLYTLKNMGAALEIHAVGEGQTFEAGGLKVTGRLNPHGTTKALAYRLEEKGRRSLVYASDCGYTQNGPTTEVLELYRGADVLVHDCTYTPEDRAERLGRGFSSILEAAQAAARAEVKHLVMFHYDQDYSDEQVDALMTRCRQMLDEAGGKHIKLTAAAEGLTIRL